MKRLVVVAVAALSFTSPVDADEKAAPHWGYQGEMSPTQWGKEFPVCGNGKAQAPVDIRGPFGKAARAIRPAYKEGALRIVNNGHTLQVNVDPGSKLMIGRESFDLLQFHFHRPSEEIIDGKPMAMVVHFVHRSRAGKLAVLGVLLKEGAENATLRTLWAHAPMREGPEVVVPGAKINPAALIPKDLHYYSFEGSLTTPPCTEGVAFYILKTPAPISRAQVEAFPFELNARPVQPLNGRKIVAN